MQISLPSKIFADSERDNQPWLLSYSDMVTLLLAFFVLFFAISQLDQSKFEMIMQYFNQGEIMPLHELETRFQQLIKAHQLEQSVDVELTPDGLQVNFEDKILFDSGQAELKQEAYPVLAALTEIFKGKEVQGRKITVEGHTDTVPISQNSPYPSNWELSSARSARVIRYFIENGLAPKQFVAVGYADTRLRAQETPEMRGLSVNRRVTLLIK